VSAARIPEESADLTLLRPAHVAFLRRFRGEVEWPVRESDRAFPRCEVTVEVPVVSARARRPYQPGESPRALFLHDARQIHRFSTPGSRVSPETHRRTSPARRVKPRSRAPAQKRRRVEAAPEGGQAGPPPHAPITARADAVCCRSPWRTDAKSEDAGWRPRTRDPKRHSARAAAGKAGRRGRSARSPGPIRAA
jgi:hypothetical protein